MAKWTREQYDSYLKATGGKSALSSTPKSAGVTMPDAYRSKVQGWRTIGGKKCYFKSLYEINYAHYLQFLKANKQIIDWEYEPKDGMFAFPRDKYKTGPFAYRPDFRVQFTPGYSEWHEVKGWMNPSSKKKLKRFATHFPKEKMVVIDKDWFKEAAKKIKPFIPDWESLPKSARSVF